MMQLLKLVKPTTVTLTLGVLAACGGGGGTPAVVDAPTFGDTESAASSRLAAVVLDAAAGTVAADTGRLNRGENTGNIGGLSGTLSADRSRINLTGGGAVEFTGEADAFAARFTAAQGAVNTLGIAGIATTSTDLPGGEATYTGDTVITAQSGTDVYELTGVANITAAFGGDTPTVTTALTALAGDKQPALGAIEAVADAGALTISGSAITGTGFNGGTAELTSIILALSGDETVSVQGAFYGPGADEVGGVFIIEDGTTRIFGDFLAD
jgi:hypothetical protein